MQGSWIQELWRYHYICKLVSWPASFVYAGRRHKALRSETNDDIPHSKSSSFMFEQVLPWSLSPIGWHGSSGGCCTSVGLCHNWRIPRLRNPNLWKGTASKPVWHLPQRKTLPLLHWTTNKPALTTDREMTSIFQGYLPFKYLQETVWDKSCQCFSSQSMQNLTKIRGQLFPNTNYINLDKFLEKYNLTKTCKQTSNIK